MDTKLIDSNSTTTDWQNLANPIAVLPIGALEQHGEHLPLCTDTIEAEYFAKFVGTELNAAVLPPVSIAQSLEHKGFRGTISLKPDTLKAIVSDITDELESQHFKTLIIINAHGGNFALAPAIREINRQDRPIKILLMNFWDYDNSSVNIKLNENEVHAGAWETSVMLAIAPDLVGKYDAVKPSEPSFNGKQRDLNHFGIGVIRPYGVWGDPSKASQQAGEEIVCSIKTNLLAAIKERLKWLNNNPIYSGIGNVIIRKMTEFDISQCAKLSYNARWNQLECDWKLLQRSNPEGAFVAVCNGKVVGTVTTTNYDGQIGWIGMVIVDKSMQRRGIATKLMKTAMDALRQIKSFKLDATVSGKFVYEKLGFTEQITLTRMTANFPIISKSLPQSPNIRAMKPSDIDTIANLDATVLGAQRKEIIAGLYDLAPQYAFVLEDNDIINGFVMGRRGARFEFIGPIVCDCLDAAKQLLNATINNTQGLPVCIDMPNSSAQWRNWLQSVGFSPQRQFSRMYLGKEAAAGNTNLLFAVAGPELG